MSIIALRTGFKHVDRAIADKVLSGSVRIGTFEHYQNGEGHRADKLEGKTLNNSGAYRQGVGFTPHEIIALRSLGMHFNSEMHSAGNVFIDCSSTMSVKPAYIFCCSKEPDFGMAKRDDLAIFEITNLSIFADRVTKASEGLLRERIIGSVTYEARTGNPFIAGPVLPDPFKKRPEFEYERELRIVWPLADRPREQSVTLSAPAVSELLRQIY